MKARFLIPVRDRELPEPSANDLLQLARDGVAVLADERFGEGNWEASDFAVGAEPGPTGDGRFGYRGTAEVTERSES